AANGNGFAAQRRIEQLLNRCIERIEVGVKDGGYCVHPDRLPERKMVRRRTATPANLNSSSSPASAVCEYVLARILDIASASRPTSLSRNEFAKSVARNAARTSPPQILIASSTSVSKSGNVPAVVEVGMEALPTLSR